MTRTPRPLALYLLLLSLFAGSAGAQVPQRPAQPVAPTVSVSTTPSGVRFIAPGAVSIRLEVYDPSGANVFGSKFRDGNVSDWQARAGGFADGTYTCVLTVRDLARRFHIKQATVLLRGGEVSLALGEAEAAGEAVPGAAQAADGGETGAATLSTHDGRDGAVTSTAGALTLRTGDVLRGEDKERVRVTEDGRVGVGTDKPEATLDVAGFVRAQGGFKFSDGSTLDTSAGRLTLRDAGGQEVPAQGVTASAATANRLAKFADSAGTLTDSGVTETGVNVGVGTAAPASPLTVFSTTNVSPFAVEGSHPIVIGFAVDNAAAGSKRWAFQVAGPSHPQGISNGSFIFRQGTNDLNPLVIGPTGNVGVGTASPQAKLDVVGNGLFTGNLTVTGTLNASGSALTGLNASNVTSGTLDNARLGVVPVSKGGTGISSVGAAGNVLRSNGSVWQTSALQASDVPSGSTHYIQNTNVQQPSSNFSVSGTGAVGGTLTSGGLTVDTNTLHVDAANNRVGFGLTNPGARLHVNGDAVIEGGLLGVGTASPSFPLTVSGNAGANQFKAAAEFFNGQADTGLRLRNTTAGGRTWTLFSSGASSAYGVGNFGIIDVTANAARLSIDSTGDVGIGVTAPAVRLDVAGAVNASTHYNLGGEKVLSVTGGAGVSANSNLFIGHGAGQANTPDSPDFGSGTDNTFVGQQAGAANTSGNLNAFFGSEAGEDNTMGDNNAFFGAHAGFQNTLGSGNTFVGAQAGVQNQTGNYNTFVGLLTGQSGGRGDNLTFIGKNADASAQGFSYATAIGADALATGSNSVTLGRAADGVRVPGSLVVTGNVSKGSGSFKIDHPLDPANKYLYHSFVESPDMMNVYNGNVTTDARGLAVVRLPDYFDALKRDFRYQLTVLGRFAQAIVLRKIKDNQFVIKTSKPRVEVSWQVTGIRQDAYANSHRIPVEEEKPAAERGTYLHPDAFGAADARTAGASRTDAARFVRGGGASQHPLPFFVDSRAPPPYPRCAFFCRSHNGEGRSKRWHRKRWKWLRALS